MTEDKNAVVTPENQLFAIDQKILELIEERMLLLSSFPEEERKRINRERDNQFGRLMRLHKMSGLSKIIYRVFTFLLTSSGMYALKKDDEWIA